MVSGVPRGRGVWGVQPPPPQRFRRPSKFVPNSNRLWKLLKIAEFRTPTPQDVRKKGSKILKLPSVRNCFTLAMTNKLAVIINSLKVPKIKKILLYEMKFLLPNYSCLQNPWLGGLPPPDPSTLCPQLNFLNPPAEQISWVRHWIWLNVPNRYGVFGQGFRNCIRVPEQAHTRLLLTHLLTYSMVQSPSWEANWFVASQEIPRISRNPKVHYRTHKRPPPISILDQPNPVHIPTSHLLEIHPNLIHPSTPRSPQPDCFVSRGIILHVGVSEH